MPEGDDPIGAPPKGLIGLVLALLAWASLAQAHLLPARNATLHLIDRRAYLVVSIPVSALSGVDDNADGLLSGEELNRHKADIGRQFTEHFHVGSPEGEPTIGFLWVANPQSEALIPPPSDYVVVLAGEAFPRKPASVWVRTDLFGRAVGDGQMTLRASRGADVEVGVLSATSPRHAFFRGPLATLGDFIRLGVEHILLGPDHLLFLLTVVIAGAGWRYWTTVITGFTVAHSITLSLAVLGVVKVSPSLVEPAIAASIVLMAADNLIRGSRVGRERTLLVLACGLLHGLGFASALGEVGLDPANRIASLAGFNIGVEVGQVLFVAAVLGVTLLVRRLAGPRAIRLWPAAASGFAAIAGLAMIVDRAHGLAVIGR